MSELVLPPVFDAFDGLEVGPVRVEAERLVMPYVVVRGEERAQTELVYRYDEPVFDPDDPASVALASVIGAQLALNYGLFTKELRFLGPFTHADRQLLRDMAANTAREIYVKKLLEPNPLLVDGARGLEPQVVDTYLRAKLTFDEGAAPEEGLPWGSDPEKKRIAVLASGGKESLLSQGLLEELGYEVHALFANESGRHWFTALNGFRHLSATRETTARVYTTCDRVFGWFQRHLPFVRPDVARMRSDEYPVRLWTVAVFGFGVLPLMKKRGLTQLVIGDELDTTRQCEHAGIPHYDGLYDQSRFFDEALSRYYRRRGFGISQFSILRPVSELGVLKTLVERYPELQAQQVSCHAAHMEDERAKPCGRCEKCRRVVGMLVALGGDPARCGYGPEQVERCLRLLAQGGAHQEEEGAAHLAWMLVQGGHIPPKSPFAAGARPHPEVMGLRFAPVEAPLNAIPVTLRAPLYTLLLAHLEGAKRRRGKGWMRFDVLASRSLTRPYAFETKRPGSAEERIPPGRSDHILGELTWPQAQRRFRETDVALLPVGAIEQHGPHLPLDIDAYDARYQALEVAAACSSPRPLVLPLIPYGVSYHHEDFAGTLSFSPETLSKVVYEVGMGAARNGIRKLVIINGHGGNIPALHFAAQMINRDAHIFTCVDTGETSDSEISEIVETQHDVHAGEYETSTALATRPHLVFMEHARAFVPRFNSRYLDFGSNVSVDWYARTQKLSESGVMGDPTRASREKGEAIWAVTLKNMVEFVEFLKGASLDEIYRRRE